MFTTYLTNKMIGPRAQSPTGILSLIEMGDISLGPSMSLSKKCVATLGIGTNSRNRESYGLDYG